MKKITGIGIKEEDKPFRMEDPELFKAKLSKLAPGRYNNDIYRVYRKATHKQWKYLFGLVYPRSMEALNNAGYEFTEIEDVDNFWKILFANRKVLDRNTGEIITIPMSKAEFDTVDEITYTDAIRAYCSEYLDTDIPDPDPNWKLHKGK